MSDLFDRFERLSLTEQLALVAGAGMGFIALAAILGRRAGSVGPFSTASIVGGISSVSPKIADASDRRIAALLPEVAEMAQKLIRSAAKAGIPLVVTQGYRTAEEQNALFAQGRTAPGIIVTDAPAGYSWHEYRRAFDVAPLNSAGQPYWPEDLAFWARIGALGKAVGLEWGGDWKGFQDRPHFEYHPGLTIADARAGRA